MNKYLKSFGLAFRFSALSSLASAELTTMGSGDFASYYGRLLRVTYGDKVRLGNGQLQTFQVHNPDGSTAALGVRFPSSVFTNLPHEANDGLNCWDLNSDNSVDLHDECSGGHNRTLFFGKTTTPFKWISVDWEPHGHIPENTYGAQHFDFHFYLTDIVERNKIAVGPCMPGTINCAQKEIAIKPVPPQYIHPDFFNTNLAFSRMGNHWADKTAPEFNGGTFTQTFILGSYDGRITFYEPMVSLEYLKKKTSSCFPIKQPAKFATAGNYPTSYCIVYVSRTGHYAVFLEKFVARAAN